jgi:hypothetical protein
LSYYGGTKSKPAVQGEHARKQVTPALEARLMAHYARLVAAAEREVSRKALIEKWAPWEGTPETNEKIDIVPCRRRASPLERMRALGKISEDELAAGEEIASVAEMIERTVGVRSNSLEARVDYAGSARDALVESLGRIRMEVAYTAWRNSLVKPPRLVLDMILTNVSYVAIAARYEIPYRIARKRLVSALRAWPEFKYLARIDVKPEDVIETYQRIGDGRLLPPKPKNPQPSEDQG